MGAASLAARPRRGLVARVGRAASGLTTVELPLTRFPVLATSLTAHLTFRRRSP